MTRTYFLQGAPAADSPHRCHANRRNGERCKKWSLTRSAYCQFHGGRRTANVNIGHLPVFYSKVLNQTLQDALKAAVETDPHEQLNLFEELALMRMTAADAVQLWGIASEKGSIDSRIAAGEIMKAALAEVVKTCEVAARVSATGADKVSVHNITHVVRQIVRIAFEVMGKEEAQLFERLVRERVKVSTGTTGTTSTPDEDVAEMDGTIPQEVVG